MTRASPPHPCCDGGLAGVAELADAPDSLVLPKKTVGEGLLFAQPDVQALPLTPFQIKSSANPVGLHDTVTVQNSDP